MRRTDQSLVERGVKLYQHGYSSARAAQEVGLSKSVLDRQLRSLGIKHRAARTSQATKASIIKLYLEGHSGPEIKQMLGISRSVVYQTLQANGISGKKLIDSGERRQPLYRLTVEQEDKLIEMYQTGVPSNEIMKRMEIGHSILRSTLQRRNIHLRGSLQKRMKFSETQTGNIITFYQDGASLQETARQFQTSYRKVHDLFLEKGIEQRKSGHSAHGPNAANWKGGRIRNTKGYVEIRLGNDDPFYGMTTQDGYILEHRLVMARSVGRLLDQDETVHHINGDRQDNRIENLQLCQGKHGTGVAYICYTCGSHDVGPESLSVQKGAL